MHVSNRNVVLRMVSYEGQNATMGSIFTGAQSWKELVARKILIKKGQMLADGHPTSPVNCYKPALLVYKGRAESMDCSVWMLLNTLFSRQTHTQL